MITSIEIKNLRGIREGRLDDLTPLTILVGANGCGKSTVLEALLIAASPYPLRALGEVVRQRGGVPDGAKWLLADGSETALAQVKAGTTEGDTTTRRVRYIRSASAGALQLVAEDGQTAIGQVGFQADGSYGEPGGPADGLAGVPDAKLVDTADLARNALIPDIFTDAALQPGIDLVDHVRSVVPDVSEIRVLSHSMKPVLHFRLPNGGVPVALSGDGVHALVRLALELASPPGTLVLLEEPEVHQHPAAVRATARAILVAVRRGVQVVLATHSLELVEDLLAEARAMLDQVSVFGLALRDGQLINSRHPGDDARFAVFEIGQDLR